MGRGRIGAHRPPRVRCAKSHWTSTCRQSASQYRYCDCHGSGTSTGIGATATRIGTRTDHTSSTSPRTTTRKNQRCRSTTTYRCGRSHGPPSSTNRCQSNSGTHPSAHAIGTTGHQFRRQRITTTHDSLLNQRSWSSKFREWIQYPVQFIEYRCFTLESQPLARNSLAPHRSATTFSTLTPQHQPSGSPRTFLANPCFRRNSYQCGIDYSNQQRPTWSNHRPGYGRCLRFPARQYVGYSQRKSGHRFFCRPYLGRSRKADGFISPTNSSQRGQL